MPIDITDQQRRTQLVISGTGPYSVDWEILDEGDVALYRDAALLTLNTDYTVEINEDGTFAVTLISSTGTTLTALGARPYRRVTDYAVGGDLRADTLNLDLDSLQIQILQLKERTDRSFALSPTGTFGGNLTFPPPGASYYIRWNNLGTALEAVASVVESGTFLASGTGAVTRAVNAKLGEFVSVLDFGATGDGVTNDLPAIRRAMTSGAKYVVFPQPAAFYAVNNTDSIHGAFISVPNGVFAIGLGRPKVKMVGNFVAGGEVFTIDGRSDCGVIGFEVECDAAVTGNNGIGIAKGPIGGTTLFARVTVRDNYVHGFKANVGGGGGCGIVAEIGGHGVLIEGNTVIDCDNGIWVGFATAYPIRAARIANNFVKNITNSQSTDHGGAAFSVRHHTSVDAGDPADIDCLVNFAGNSVDGAPKALHMVNAGLVNCIGGITAGAITLYGVLMENCWYCNVVGNTIKGDMTTYVRITGGDGDGSWHNDISHNNFSGTASSNGIVCTSGVSRNIIAFNKMQGITGDRHVITLPTENVIIDQDDAAANGKPESLNGILIPNDQYLSIRNSSGTLIDILKMNSSNELVMNRPGGVEFTKLAVTNWAFTGGSVALKRVAPTYGTAITIDLWLGNEFDITVTNGTGFTINDPSNGTDGQIFSITVRNTSGGVVGTITWGTTTYKMATWTSPANGQSRTITFKWNGTNAVEMNRTAADVPN